MAKQKSFKPLAFSFKLFTNLVPFLIIYNEKRQINF
jgi:hypothetical protein